jgi:hypothetical protein
MTCAYNTYFVLTWLTAILAIPTAIVMIIWTIGWNWIPMRVAIGVTTTLLLIIWTIYLRTHGPRVLVRSGAFPAFCTGDYFPRTEKELIDAAFDIYTKTGRAPAVVGSGWAHFLYRRGPRGPRIFLHNYVGPVPLVVGDGAGVERWRSGTTITTINKHLRSRVSKEAPLGLTFRTHPTMDYISIGAWFACSNHGNGGANAGKSSDALKTARVLDMTAIDKQDPEKKYIKRWTYKKLRTEFDLEFKRIRYNASTTEPIRWCILDCEFNNEKIAENTMIQKRCIVVEDENSAAEWLNNLAHLRLLFVGKARKIGLGVQWLPTYEPNNPHVDPHFCSRWCNFFQVDIFSVVWGWYESSYKKNAMGVKLLTEYDGRTERYHANMWMPTVWPWQTVTVVLAGYRNFEIFFYLPGREQLTGKSLWKLVSGLIGVHKKHGGRSEIRHGAPTGAICLDVSMNRDYIAIFKFLWEALGVDEVAFHLGKFNDPREIKPYVEMGQRRVMLHELGRDEYFA